MKERKSLKEMYNKYEDPIQVSLIAIVIIAIFGIGVFTSWKFIFKPLSEEQFELCEQIALDVYEQKGKLIIVEASENFSVEISSTTIMVRSSDWKSIGRVCATLQNGELVMTRYPETGIAVALNALVGVLFIIGAATIVRIFFCK